MDTNLGDDQREMVLANFTIAYFNRTIWRLANPHYVQGAICCI